MSASRTTETLATQRDETAAGFHQSWFPLVLASELGAEVFLEEMQAEIDRSRDTTRGRHQAVLDDARIDDVPDGDDLVLLYFPLRRKPPHNRSLALWTDPDRDAAGENPVLNVEFVAEGCVRFEQLKGRFRHLPRAAGDEYDFARAGVRPVDELFRAGHRPELPSRPQDLGPG